ncbi:hypothetical protein [Roseomonas sp. BN140053]|uniref:hypothetical protein n=1 Tax=Roseomonas sp. BN140053 TaxID=3391898 RepID=UPI0039EB6CCE
MSGCCDEDDEGLPRFTVGGEVLVQARLMESTLPGAPVSEQSWCILAGVQSGALRWRDHQRMLFCLDRAGKQAAAAAFWRGRAHHHRQGMRCDIPAAWPGSGAGWPRAGW